MSDSDRALGLCPSRLRGYTAVGEVGSRSTFGTPAAVYPRNLLGHNPRILSLPLL